MERGYVKLWRLVNDTGVIGNALTAQLYLWLMLNVTRTKKTVMSCGQMVTLNEGEVICGRKQLANQLNTSEQQVRTAISNLQKMSIVTSRATNRFTIISFVNWNRYQYVEHDNQPTEQPAINQQSNQQSTSNQPTINQQNTTKQEYKNKEIRNKNKKTEKASVADLQVRIQDFTESTELREALTAFVDMRAEKKKSVTVHGFDLLLKKLGSFSQETQTQIAIVNRSVINNWLDFYAPSEKQNAGFKVQYQPSRPKAWDVQNG